MGLDQYLLVRNALWKHGSDRLNKADEVLDIIGVAPARREKFLLITVEWGVMTWRKANQIHNWFVRNVQGGEDDCKLYCVSNERLKELLDLCKRVKNDPSLAAELLPTQGGFFFGSTEYDEEYMGDIQDTIDGLTKALVEAEPDDYFYYTSSW